MKKVLCSFMALQGEPTDRPLPPSAPPHLEEEEGGGGRQAEKLRRAWGQRVNRVPSRSKVKESFKVKTSEKKKKPQQVQFVFPLTS